MVAGGPSTNDKGGIIARPQILHPEQNGRSMPVASQSMMRGGDHCALSGSDSVRSVRYADPAMMRLRLPSTNDLQLPASTGTEAEKGSNSMFASQRSSCAARRESIHRPGGGIIARPQIPLPEQNFHSVLSAGSCLLLSCLWRRSLSSLSL